MKLEEWTAKGATFTWIDVTNPTTAELTELATKHGIVDAHISGCLDPEHMPKFESFGDFRAIILRGYDADASLDALTVHKLTRKLVLFIGPKLLLTVHRTELPYLGTIRSQLTSAPATRVITLKSLLHEIIGNVVQTYDAPLAQQLSVLADLEDRTFHPDGANSLLEDGYYLRRKVSVLTYMSTLMSEAIHLLAASFPKGPANTFAYLAERCNRLAFHTGELTENVDNLLNLHLSMVAQKTNVASQKANEVMRLLTLVSVFFLPLNLIAGIYGMNFENMPELKNPDGYRLTLIVMTLIAFAILVGFWRKGWLVSQDESDSETA